MGITIHYRLKQSKGFLKDNLDVVEKTARLYAVEAKRLAIPFSVERASDHRLRIDIGGCETLAFYFKNKADILQEKEKENYSYLYETLTDGGKKQIDEGYDIKRFPYNEQFYCSGFCKTQFAHNVVEHLWVANLIKILAGFCSETSVSDEGDYYHSGKTDDAVIAIDSLGKMIDGLGKTLAGNGFEIIKGGETKIKS